MDGTVECHVCGKFIVILYKSLVLHLNFKHVKNIENIDVSLQFFSQE